MSVVVSPSAAPVPRFLACTTAPTRTETGPPLAPTVPLTAMGGDAGAGAVGGGVGAGAGTGATGVPAVPPPQPVTTSRRAASDKNDSTHDLRKRLHSGRAGPLRRDACPGRQSAGRLKAG